MSGIDFSKYPKVLELLDDTSMADMKERIKWIGMQNSEAAVLLAEMHQMCKAGLSHNIPLRARSKNSANFYFGAVSSGLHVFAREEARAELGLSHEDVSKLFSHKSFLGGLHNEFYIEFPLEDQENI
jgi:hypothetical protein